MGVNPNWALGRTRQVYAAEESSFATAPALASTDAKRHLGIKLKFTPNSVRQNPQRNVDPSKGTLLRGRQAADWSFKGQMYTAGTGGVLPEGHVFYKNSFGAEAAVTLSTTFSGTPTTTGGTVGAVTGLIAANQPVGINIASGAFAGYYVRWLTAAPSGSVLAWAPALPAAPVAGDSLTGLICYSLASTLPKSLDVAAYQQVPAASAPSVEMLGCVCDKISFMFDSNSEPMFEVSGPAQGYAGTNPTFSPQSQPGAFTAVGSDVSIPSGLTGSFRFGGTIYEIEKFQIDMTNGMELKNTAFGTYKANGYERTGVRMVTAKINAKVSDDTTLWAASLATSQNTCFIQDGDVAGVIYSMWMPKFTLTDNPDTPDSDGTNNWDYAGQATRTSGNDELFMAVW